MQVKKVTLEFTITTGNVQIRTANTIEDQTLRTTKEIDGAYGRLLAKGKRWGFRQDTRR